MINFLTRFIDVAHIDSDGMILKGELQGKTLNYLLEQAAIRNFTMRESINRFATLYEIRPPIDYSFKRDNIKLLEHYGVDHKILDRLLTNKIKGYNLGQ